MVDQNTENDKEWILEIMAEFLQSPLWKNQIISFVEEKCVIFEDEDENRLEYTEIHMQFKRLVESKLEAYIQDLGISQQDFVMAQSRAQSRIHKSLLQQIMAVEDFMLFKKMMVNRNIAINKEAMKQMEQKGRQTNKIAKAVAQAVSSSEEESSEDDMDEEMKRVMEESKKTADAEEERRKARVQTEQATQQRQAAEAEQAKVDQAKAVEEAKVAEESKQKQEEDQKQARIQAAKNLQAKMRAAKAAKEEASAAASGDGGTSGLPGIHKPKSTGLALFKDIEIQEGDGADVQEEKSQRQALRAEKEEMIAERNRNRQAEQEAAEKAKQAASETEDQEAKMARIQRGLQALSLAPTDDVKKDKRTAAYKNLRQQMD